LKAIAGLDPSRPVFVEAESRKIGNLHVPEAMIERIRGGDCVAIDATLDARVAFLLKDYDYFLTLPDFLCQRLDALRTLQSSETLNRWQQLIRDAAWPTLVRELLELHYDPLYRRSQERNFAGMQDSGACSTDDLSEDGIKRLATVILQSRTAQMA
jgi:tRNA 2-selenouridine synthase